MLEEMLATQLARHLPRSPRHARRAKVGGEWACRGRVPFAVTLLLCPVQVSPRPWRVTPEVGAALLRVAARPRTPQSCPARQLER